MVANDKDKGSFQAERGAHLHCSEGVPSNLEPSNVTSSFLELFCFYCLLFGERRVGCLISWSDCWKSPPAFLMFLRWCLAEPSLLRHTNVFQALRLPWLSNVDLCWHSHFLCARMNWNIPNSSANIWESHLSMQCFVPFHNIKRRIFVKKKYYINSAFA